ncbi:hypothetical protein [Oryzibacter oryziterrae]|uniref:hypothetical protein n=1 Tax=Oryzibacter oryziterrae TaxID=2766474 RepID=UPI001F22706F|nr:hypothetical protein [Oryzibacter oryziterrae]
MSFFAPLATAFAVSLLALQPASAGGLDALTLKKLEMLAKASNEQAASTGSPQATINGSGFIQVTATVTLKSPSLATSKVTCTLETSVMDNFTSSYLDTATANATVKSGKATCTIKMAVNWPGLTSGSALAVSLSVLTPDVSATTIARTHTRTLSSSATIPTNGSTTSFTAAVTL